MRSLSSREGASGEFGPWIMVMDQVMQSFFISLKEAEKAPRCTACGAHESLRKSPMSVRFIRSDLQAWSQTSASTVVFAFSRHARMYHLQRILII